MSQDFRHYELPARLIAGIATIGLAAAAFSLETRDLSADSAADVFLTPTLRLDTYSAYSFSVAALSPARWRFSIGLLVSACLMVVHDFLQWMKWESRHMQAVKMMPAFATAFAMFNVLRLAGFVHLDTLVVLSLLSALVVRVNEIMHHHVSHLSGGSWQDMLTLWVAPSVGVSIIALLAVEYNKVIRAVHPTSAIDTIVIASGVLFGVLAVWPPVYWFKDWKMHMHTWSALAALTVMQVFCSASWLAYVIQRNNGTVDNAVAMAPVIAAL